MLLELFNRCIQAEYIHKPNGVDYAIEIDGNTLYILFECSDDREDWKANFKFFPIPWKPYKNMNNGIWFCHRGFLGFWKSVKDEIEKKVAEILKENPNILHIVSIGYSHGGALATLCTEDMTYLYRNKYCVCGFGYGSPRVIWGIIPKKVKDRFECFNVIRNIPDIVTHAPPVLFGFRNVGNLIKIGKAFKYTPIKAHYSSAYIKEIEIYKGDK